MTDAHTTGPASGDYPNNADRPDAAELAALYAAGLLTLGELTEFTERLLSGEAELRREVERLNPVIEAALEAESLDPPSSVKNFVMSTIAPPARASDSWAALAERARAIGTGALSGVQDAGVFVERALGGSWKRVGLPGVLVKTLFEDRAANRRTQLVRCEPGAYIPEHQHGGIEELLVLDGNLRVGALLLGPGDYFRAMPGAEHGEVRSPDGCVCLFFTSYATLSPTTRGLMGLRVLRELVRRLFGKR